MLLMADRCCSSCLTYGRGGLAEGLGDLGRLMGLEMQLGGHMEGIGKVPQVDTLILSWRMAQGCDWGLGSGTWVWRVAVLGLCNALAL